MDGPEVARLKQRLFDDPVIETLKFSVFWDNGDSLSVEEKAKVLNETLDRLISK